MSELKQPWIITGYALFSKEGPKGLKVEVIARKVKKNKSSFYYHFTDAEIFTSALLKYHVERVKLLVEKSRSCKNLNPEWLLIFLNFKQEVFFNRQLRVNRSNPEFKLCFNKVSELIGSIIVGMWTESLGFNKQSDTARTFLNLMSENFYLRITEDTFTFEWLVEYLKEAQTFMNNFKRDIIQTSNKR